MSLGPLELLVEKFPGNDFKGEIAPALAELVDNGTIRVLDILFARKEKNGEVIVLEINDLGDDAFNSLVPVVTEASGWLNDEDVQQLTQGLENNSPTALMLFENTWATRFRDAVVNAKGQVILNERIPSAVVEQLIAE